MALPATMKVVGMPEEGKTVVDFTLPVPLPGPGEVLIKVAVSGVNPVDRAIVHQYVPFGRTRPFVLGCDCAGTVVRVGEGVSSFAVGDVVMGMTGGIEANPQGTLAEYAIADARMILKKPATMTLEEAAALPLPLLTAWEGLREMVRVSKDDVVLVNGATGGVGSMCVQIARHAGATVYGTGSPSKRELIERHGAHYIDYHDVEALQRAKTAHTPHGEGFSIIYDAVGGPWVTTLMPLVAPCGHLLSILAMQSYDVTPLALKNASLHFPMTCTPYLFPANERYRDRVAVMLREAAPLLEHGAVRPVVDTARTYAFTAEDVLQAQTDLAEHKNRGKLVVHVAA